MGHMCSAIAVLAVAGTLYPSVAGADSQTIKGTAYYHGVVWQGFDVGDVEGHVVGAYENKGVSLYEDGEEVETVVRGTLDFVKGLGKVAGYDIRLYDDGSRITLEYHGEAKMTPDGRVVSGTYTSCIGVGRFEGAKCNGTWTGGMKGESLSVFEWEITYTVPN